MQPIPQVENQVSLKKRSTGAGQFMRALSAIIWKDLAAELRSRELLSAMLVFALLVILIFNFALELDARARSTVTAGVLWVTFAFAGTLGLTRSMAMEKDRGCLDGLLLAPVDRSAIYFGKAIGNLVFMLIVEAIVLPIYTVLYSVNLFAPGLLLVILLGSIGYVAVGTLLSSMAVQTRTPRRLASHPAVPDGYPGADRGGQSQQWFPPGYRYRGYPPLDKPAGCIRRGIYCRRLYGV